MLEQANANWQSCVLREQSQEASANALAFGATMCKYAFEWYIDIFGRNCWNEHGESDP